MRSLWWGTHCHGPLGLAMTAEGRGRLLKKEGFYEEKGLDLGGCGAGAGSAILLEVGEKLTLVTPAASGANTYNGESGYLTVHRNDLMQRNWNEERDYLYPIPTKERVLTNGALTQNPGWADGLGL